MGFGEMVIQVDVDTKGISKIEVKGGDGDNCLKATKDLEEAMGKVTKRVMKPEGLKQSHAGQQVKLGK